MTNRDQYIAYVLSRFFSGFFGSIAVQLGSRIIVDLYFLHQRGRAFTAIWVASDFGIVAGPTFSALVAANAYWPSEYWWSIACLGLSIILVFFLLEETSFERDQPVRDSPVPKAFVTNRIETFLFGTRSAQNVTWKEVVR